jgi:glutamate-1-semialdehyde 2,1-aminomutase
LKENDITTHVAHIGELMKEVWRNAGAKHSLPVKVAEGYPCLAHFAFDHEQANELKTVFTTRMLRHGFLAGTAIYPTFGHNEEIVSRYGDALNVVFVEMAEALGKGGVSAMLEGPPAHQGFRRLL